MLWIERDDINLRIGNVVETSLLRTLVEGSRTDCETKSLMVRDAGRRVGHADRRMIYPDAAAVGGRVAPMCGHPAARKGQQFERMAVGIAKLEGCYEIGTPFSTISMA